MRNIIAYIYCSNSDVISVHVVDAEFSDKETTICGHKYRYFYVNRNGGYYTQIVKEIAELIRSADIIYADTSKSDSYITKLITLTSVVPYYKDEDRPFSVELSNSDRGLMSLVSSTLVYYDNMDEKEFISILNNNLIEINRDAAYQQDLLTIIKRAIIMSTK